MNVPKFLLGQFGSCATSNVVPDVLVDEAPKHKTLAVGRKCPQNVGVVVHPGWPVNTVCDWPILEIIEVATVLRQEHERFVEQGMIDPALLPIGTVVRYSALSMCPLI
jgi:hypothetical protein